MWMYKYVTLPKGTVHHDSKPHMKTCEPSHAGKACQKLQTFPGIRIVSFTFSPTWGCSSSATALIYTKVFIHDCPEVTHKNTHTLHQEHDVHVKVPDTVLFKPGGEEKVKLSNKLTRDHEEDASSSCSCAEENQHFQLGGTLVLSCCQSDICKLSFRLLLDEAHVFFTSLTQTSACFHKFIGRKVWVRAPTRALSSSLHLSKIPPHLCRDVWTHFLFFFLFTVFPLESGSFRFCSANTVSDYKLWQCVAGIVFTLWVCVCVIEDQFGPGDTMFSRSDHGVGLSTLAGVWCVCLSVHHIFVTCSRGINAYRLWLRPVNEG